MRDLVKKVTNLYFNHNVSNLFDSYGYKINNISWEDTARTKGSCWGPNISDMTLKLKTGENMPMIRKPNFSDLTYDISIDNFKVPVDGKIISLKEYLENMGTYLNNSNIENLYCAERDSAILTQVQTCILPCEENSSVEFNINLYNYQSYSESAVLTIVVSKNGTSTQTVKGKTDLYFDNNGDAHYFKAERLSNVRNRQGKGNNAVTDFKDMTHEEKLENCLLVFQVPLEIQHYQTPRGFYLCLGDDNFEAEEEEFCDEDLFDVPRTKGVEMANLSIGSKVGTFSCVENRIIKRDKRYPIRCTYQYYRVTDTDDISQTVVKNIVECMDNINNIALNSGSLVLGNSDRVTEPNLKKNISQVNWGNECPLNI